MNRTQLNTTATVLLNLYARKLEVMNEIAEQEEKLKQYMSDNNITYLPLESANVSWIEISSQVIDNKKLKELLSVEEYANITKERISKRFTCKVAA